MDIVQNEMRKDWHSADIIAALHKRRITLAALSRAAGLSSSTLANALSRPWPNRYFDLEGQKIVRRVRCKKG